MTPVSAELEELLAGAGPFADGEPGGVVAGDGAVEQAHAAVLQVQLEAAVLADGDGAEVDFRGAACRCGGLQHVGGQLVEQLVEAAVEVGARGRRRGRRGPGRPGRGRRGSVRGSPVGAGRGASSQSLVAGEGQFVVATALPARGEDERVRERLPADGDWSGGAVAVEEVAVEVAEGGAGGVGAVALATGHARHGAVPVRTLSAGAAVAHERGISPQPVSLTAAPDASPCWRAGSRQRPWAPHSAPTGR